MITLYYVPKTRASRPRWLLEELGVPYELKVLDRTETKSPEYLKINPLGHVPALVDDGHPVFESAAIIMHLADKFPEKGLAPAPGTKERAEYYQWILFAMATLEPLVGAIGEQHRIHADPKDRDQVVIDRAMAKLGELKVLEQHLHGREFLVGGKFTAADVVMGALLGWAKMLGVLDPYPQLQEYSRRTMGRPAAKKAREG